MPEFVFDEIAMNSAEKGSPYWQFVSVNTDEGITDASTKHRESFKRIIADAIAGKIDLIVTNSAILQKTSL